MHMEKGGRGRRFLATSTQGLWRARLEKRGLGFCRSILPGQQAPVGGTEAVLSPESWVKLFSVPRLHFLRFGDTAMIFSPLPSVQFWDCLVLEASRMGPCCILSPRYQLGMPPWAGVGACWHPTDSQWFCTAWAKYASCLCLYAALGDMWKKSLSWWVLSARQSASWVIKAQCNCGWWSKKSRRAADGE